VLGLGAMVGAGVFSAWAPAARAAGGALLVGLAIAGAVAYCNAAASARLAALYPESGGTYAYGRHRLGPFWGYLAGFGFVAGKLASCAAMALTFGSYVAPGAARPLATAAVLALGGVNLLGVRKTVALTRVLVAVVVSVLIVVVAACWGGGTASLDRIGAGGGASPLDVLRSAGLLFFAFAGYARIATLGEEVREPHRTIPRAIPLALTVTLALYAAVGVAALAAAGPEALAASDAPLRTAVEAGSLDAVAPLVVAGAAVASLGVLLSLLAGVSRTVFAMASNGDLPRPLAAVHPRRRVPHRAEAAIALAIAAAVAAGVELGAAIGFSSFCVLAYYALANASALTLRAGRAADALAVTGLAGCLLLAVTLPVRAALAGAAVLAAGAVVYGARRART
jgi:APA family basic amino acid/polyamine antiporter